MARVTLVAPGSQPKLTRSTTQSHAERRMSRADMSPVSTESSRSTWGGGLGGLQGREDDLKHEAVAADSAAVQGRRLSSPLYSLRKPLATGRDKPVVPYGRRHWAWRLIRRGTMWICTKPRQAVCHPQPVERVFGTLAWPAGSEHRTGQSTPTPYSDRDIRPWPQPADSSKAANLT